MPVHTHVREVVNVASSSWPAARRVAVHFAPVTTAYSGHVRRASRPAERDRGELPTREDFILAYFRDGNGRWPLEQLARRGHRVVLFGQPRSVPQGVEVHSPNVQGVRRGARALPGGGRFGGQPSPRRMRDAGHPDARASSGERSRAQDERAARRSRRDRNRQRIRAMHPRAHSTLRSRARQATRRARRAYTRNAPRFGGRPRAIEELCRHRAEPAAWKTRTA